METTIPIKEFDIFKKVTSENGWVSPNGNFISCRPDEHDQSAWFTLRKFNSELYEKIMADDAHDMYMNPRMALSSLGYVHLSSNNILPPESKLSEDQYRLLDEAGLKIPVEINNIDSNKLIELLNIADTLQDPSLSNEDRDLIRLFLTKKDNRIIFYEEDVKKAERLFELLTRGLVDAGYYHDKAPFGLENIAKYRYSPVAKEDEIPKIVVKTQWHHHHSGDSSDHGKIEEQSVSVVDFSEVISWLDGDPRKIGRIENNV